MNTAIVGLSFGDEGKGSIVDYLARRDHADLIVRFNGGPQAAHHVVLADGREHCFAQFGSGTFAGARTFLSRFMLISVGALMEERNALVKNGIHQPMSGLIIDRDALVITPYHVAYNRVLELQRGDGRHGSCGRGIGAAVEDDLFDPKLSIRVRDLVDYKRLFQKLERIRERKMEQLQTQLCAPTTELLRNLLVIFDDHLKDRHNSAEVLFYAFGDGVQVVDREWLTEQRGTIIFEGAQGVLLDQDAGFHPHTTWSTTTFENADVLSREAGLEPPRRVGVLRSYATRHGAGPFPTEDATLQPSPREHNVTGAWQGAFRLGHFDGVLARYAIEACGRVDELALTHLDAVQRRWPACDHYKHGLNVIEVGQLKTAHAIRWMFPQLVKLSDADAFLRWVETALEVPITITSTGPTADDKQTRAEATKAAHNVTSEARC